MASKFKKWLKRGMVASFTLYCLNSITFPVLLYLTKAEISDIKNPMIQEVMDTKKYLYKYTGKDLERVAISYLKMAHLVTMNYMHVGLPHTTSIEEILLNTRVGDCSDLSTFVYSNFLYLINETDSKYLAEYVRSASGADPVSGAGHAWLEVKLNDKWIPYETTQVPHLDALVDSPLTKVDEIFPDTLVLDIELYKYKKTNAFQILPDGKVKSSLDLIGTITDYRGLVGRLIYVMKMRKENSIKD